MQHASYPYEMHTLAIARYTQLVAWNSEPPCGPGWRSPPYTVALMCAFGDCGEEVLRAQQAPLLVTYH